MDCFYDAMQGILLNYLFWYLNVTFYAVTPIGCQILSYYQPKILFIKPIYLLNMYSIEFISIYNVLLLFRFL